METDEMRYIIKHQEFETSLPKLSFRELLDLNIVVQAELSKRRVFDISRFREGEPARSKIDPSEIIHYVREAEDIIYIRRRSCFPEPEVFAFLLDLQSHFEMVMEGDFFPSTLDEFIGTHC